MDGRRVPVRLANYNFMAVALEPGEHIVRFEFKPESFYGAVRISLIGFVVLAGMAVILFLRKTKKEATPVVSS